MISSDLYQNLRARAHQKARDNQTTPRQYRIRRYSGNKQAWLLVVLRADGAEAETFGSYTTALSIDALLKHAGHLSPRPCDRVELIIS
jgi:hypothetical protein